MEDNEPDINLFENVLNHELLLYYWHQRYLGYQVEQKIDELEAEIYPPIKEGRVPNNLWQKDIDELQLLFAVADWETNTNRIFVTKTVFYSRMYTKLIIKPDKNHFRPHFHIHYKDEHKASYAIDTLELLAGTMPKKYEKPILK